MSKRSDRPNPYFQPEWRKLRRRFLILNPTCVWCGKKSVEVDHIKEYRDYPELFLDWRNLRASCHSCHSRRTAQDSTNKVVYGAGDDGYPVHPEHPWNKK